MIAIIEDQHENNFEITIDDLLLHGVSFNNYLKNGKIVGLFCKNNLVPDVCRYELAFKKGEFQLREVEKEITLSEFSDKLPIATKGRKVILLLLESPHKKEFLFKNGIITPKAPAQGKGKGDAGGAIANYLYLI